MHDKNQDFPLELLLSFEKLGAVYKDLLDSQNTSSSERARAVLSILEKHPALIEGIADDDTIAHYKEEIDEILLDVFPTALQSNEIKIASMPFQESILKASQRYLTIIANAGEDFQPEIKNFNDDHYYIMGCSIILQQYYGYKIDFRRPFYYEIPDTKGLVRYYRMLYNGDYIHIERKEGTPKIKDEEVKELLDNFTNIALWKEKFPPKGYVFKGFVIANLYDATTDVSISNFKSGLLQYDEQGDFTVDFSNVFKAIFDLTELNIGFSNYNQEEGTLEHVPFKDIGSYLLQENDYGSCDTVLCEGSYDAVFNTGAYFAISDVERYYKQSPNIAMYDTLYKQGIRSVILAPIRHKDNLLGIMELTSPHPRALNSINANKLDDLMPYLVDAILRAKEQLENDIDLVIQNECTSIHKSVYWKFEKEARRFMKLDFEGDANVQFRDVVFKDVYPLFGQIDIRNSSTSRNDATQRDILLQLTNASSILKEAYRDEKLPIYKQLLYSLTQLKTEVSDHLEVDTERKILAFIRKEIRPLFSHLALKSRMLADRIKKYQAQIEDNSGLVYKHRKEYDESVMLINKRLASSLSRKQKEAQKMYPHFFELFKTDGVEHNMYIGESITKDTNFHKIYLYNLRLWQLQVMCEMENVHYLLSRKLSQSLEVASMILVFNSALSVRYRMDEKRFDVDGTYNARYEVIKKRVDKALIKGTNERITQAGKITIVYSQKSDEREYLRYIEFLQSKKQLGSQVEILELEDLQAVTGLKAIRVNILYTQQVENHKKEFYTYEDLIETLKS